MNPRAWLTWSPFHRPWKMPKLPFYRTNAPGSVPLVLHWPYPIAFFHQNNSDAVKCLELVCHPPWTMEQQSNRSPDIPITSGHNCPQMSWEHRLISRLDFIFRLKVISGFFWSEKRKPTTCERLHSFPCRECPQGIIPFTLARSYHEAGRHAAPQIQSFDPCPICSNIRSGSFSFFDQENKLCLAYWSLGNGFCPSRKTCKILVYSLFSEEGSICRFLILAKKRQMGELEVLKND